MKEEDFMRSAIEDARKNKHHFGAVIAKNEKIISTAGKRPLGDPRYHAETQAILKATKKLKSKTLEGCTLYSTCEPCPMCFYMAWITKVSKIVFGASQKEAIKVGFKEIDVDNNYLNKRSGNRIKVEKGLLKEECLKLFNK
jgi:tRNA(Arg) A34 adenosine deaminase TadA